MPNGIQRHNRPNDIHWNQGAPLPPYVAYEIPNLLQDRGDQGRSAQRTDLLCNDAQVRGSQTLKETLTVAGVSNDTEPPDDPRDEGSMPQAQPVEDLETVVLHENQLDRCVKIGTTLMAALQFEFIHFLRHHSELFAWSYDDMPGISPEFISHKLSISSTYKPI